MVNANDRLRTALYTLARREIPDSADLWPQIAARLEEKEPMMRYTTRKLAWSLLLVLLALALLAATALAVYNYFRNDPGMEFVNQSGLTKNLQIAVEPMRLPSPTPLPPALGVGATQAVQGVSLTLDWVYLDVTWQSVGFTIHGLDNDLAIDMPILDFSSLQPEQFVGTGLSLYPADDALKGVFVVYQIARHTSKFMIAETQVDLKVEIPLLDSQQNPLGAFRFTIPAVKIHQMPFDGAGIFAIWANGAEVRLKQLLLSPAGTRTVLCVESPAGALLQRSSVSLQWVDQKEDYDTLFTAPLAFSLEAHPISAPNGKQCAAFLFPPIPDSARAVRLVVNSLESSSGVPFTGPWEFFWPELPHHISIPGISPVAKQSAGELKITLEQAYVDGLRFAAVLRIEGMSLGLFPSLTLTDLQGRPFNAGFTMAVDENDPSLYTVSFTFTAPPDENFAPLDPMIESRFEGQLLVAITSPDGQAIQSFPFNLDLPVYPALLVEAHQTALSNSLQMSLEKMEITPSYTNAYLCYQSPTPTGDWQNRWEGTRLQIGRYEASPDNYSLIWDKNFSQQASPSWASLPDMNRCIVLGFPLGHHNQPETLRLEIDGLQQSTPESIPEDQLQAARQALRAQGIEIDWGVFTGPGGGGAGPKITSKPAGISDEEVLKRFYEALGYILPATWKFELKIVP